MEPLARPASSTQVLRYRGQVSTGGLFAKATAAYPKLNGTYPTDSVIAGGGVTFTAWARFALCKSSDPTNPIFALPANVYDDSQPAGEVPHDPVACLASATLGINTSDLSLDRFSWAQNLQIHYTQIDPNVVLCDNDVSIDNDPANGAVVLLDEGASSGLGRSTGLPVIAVRFVVLTTGQVPAIQPFDVDITFEIRHSNHR